MSGKKDYFNDGALEDLREIERDTQWRHGSEQRKIYRKRLLSRIEQLRDNPELGRPRPEILPGYRSLNEGLHVIFYRLTDNGVEIRAILHARRDLNSEMK